MRMMQCLQMEGLRYAAVTEYEIAAEVTGVEIEWEIKVGTDLRRIVYCPHAAPPPQF